MKFLREIVLKRSGFWSNWLLTKTIFFNFFKDFIIAIDAAALRKSQYWDSEVLAKIQFYRLQKILYSAYKNVPFWRQYFNSQVFHPNHFRNLSDLEQVAPLTKEDIKKNFTAAIHRKIKLTSCYMDSTSGSSGTPFNFYIDRNYILRSFGLCRRIFEWAGFKIGDQIIRFDLKDRFGFARDYVCFPACLSAVELPLEMQRRVERLIALGRNHKLLLFGSGSGLLRLAKLMREQKIGLNLRGAIYSADSLTFFERDFVEDIFGCRLFNCYACREIGWLAQECEDGSLHINSEWCHIEIVDKRGRNLPRGGQGRVIVTTFDNEVMPFIRYDTGDRGRILDARCSCGRNLPILEFEGRGNEAVILPGGQTIGLVGVCAFFEKFAASIDGFQVIQEKSDTLVFNLVLRKESLFDENKFRSAAGILFGKQIDFCINFLEAIPQTGPKRRILISKLNL